MQREWYRENINKIFDHFNTSERGLTDSRVKENKERFGENVLSEGEKRTLWDIFISQFNNPLIYVLIVADVIVFFLQHYIDAFIILFIIILNAVIGVVQEGKAQDTLAALKKIVKTHANVIRDGREIRVNDYEIVAGDILVLRDGDPVAADCRIIEGNNLKVNEASLTGESESILKQSMSLSDSDVKVSDQTNMVFKGTHITSGQAKAVVVNTGIKTVIGKISKQLVGLKMDVPLKKNIANLSKLIVAIIVATSLVLFFYGLYDGYAFGEIFIVVVAITVSSIPEGLPVVVTLVLSTGVWRMSKKKVLVKKLQAVEALGQAKVVAVDKTGTITKNQMVVDQIYTFDKYIKISGDGYSPKGFASFDGKKIDVTKDENLDLLIKSSVFTSVSEVAYSDRNKEWELKYGDPTEASLLVLGRKFGYEKGVLEKEHKNILELPFELETKHHSTINEFDGKNILSVVGSPEVILDKVNQVLVDGKTKRASKADMEKIQEALDKFSKEGYRVLAIGANFNPGLDIDASDLPNLTFVGFVAILDSIRSEVYESVKSVKGAGMRVVMITGDHVGTAKAIAKKVGIYEDSDNVITGKDLMDLKDEELLEKLDNTTVFARVSPKDKLRIIELYKKKGDTIAMTGDGVNDALSLVSADLGIAMGKIGTEVAKEASDIILLDDNFGNIVEAAEEGRNIYWNIRKSILFLLSTNVVEILIISIALFAGLPLPLVAAQIIWLNLVTDSFLVIAMSFDPKAENLLKEKFKKPSKYLVDWPMGLRMLLLSGTMTVVTLVVFISYLDGDMVKATTITLVLLAMFQWFNVLNVRSRRETIFTKKLFNNKYLIASLSFVFLLHLFAIYNPLMQKILSTTALSIKEWVYILVLGFIVILVEEIRKFIVRNFEVRNLFSKRVSDLGK